MKVQNLFISLLFLVSATNAAFIGASVDKAFVTEPLYFQYNDTAREFSTETLNSGSLPYVAQLRVDVFDQNKSIFTAWSGTKRLMPGNNGFFRLFWIPEEGNYTTRYRVYFSGEVNETFRSIIVKDIPTSQSVFNMTLVDVLDDFLVMDVKSTIDVEKAVMIPKEFPQGMWIGQKQMELKAGHVKRVLIPYSSPSAQEVTFVTTSLDGKFVSSQKFKIEKRSDARSEILRLFFALLDR